MNLVPLTLEKAKALQLGDIVYEKNLYNRDGSNMRWRVNGKVQRWKRDPDRIKIPVKYGLNTYGYIENRHFTNGISQDILIEKKG